MTTVQETATGNTPMADANQAGLANISYNQQVQFNRYIRMVLPMDGFVFWMRASLTTAPDSTYNTAVYNSVVNNGSNNVPVQAPIMLTTQGSVHVTKQKQQNEDGSPKLNSVIFTAKQEIQEFNTIDPNVMWIGNFNGQKWAISESLGRYEQSGLYHYRGRELFSTMATQLVDSTEQLLTNELVVSNSLPFWLSMNSIAPVYPSYAVPQNIKPPYIAVHINPADTTALQMAPLIDITGSHWQLTHDTVKIDLYGLRNTQALAYQDYLFNAMTDDACPVSLMNSPVMQDEKAIQLEFGILAQRKTFTVEVSYYQAAMQNVARQMIRSCIPTITLADFSLST